MAGKLESVIQSISRGDKLTHVDLSNSGLVEFPSELLQLRDTLEVLNLGGNTLSSLPENVTEFKNLKILFFAQNNFEEVPIQLGELPSLYMLSFKSNKVKHIAPSSLAPSLSWLILTDNLIEELPSTIGQLRGMRKLMLAGNRLTSLPEALSNCKQLELLRISANRLTELPDWLLSMPSLAWLATAGNPLRAQTSTHAADTVASSPVDWTELAIGERLGEGASGYVHKAVWRRPGAGENAGEVLEVAVKLFKGETTSDGLPEHEMQATESVGDHPNFIQVLGRIVNAPNNQQGLVLPLLDSSPSAYQILGNPPSFTTCTRDTFVQGTLFSFERIFKVLLGISFAAAHLHNPLPGGRNRGIMHGDLYAHNILVHQSTGHALLTDFGAASFKPSLEPQQGDAPVPSASSEQSLRLEQIEVRAFGCLVEDLLDHADAASLPVLDPSALPIPPLRSAALVDAPEILACLLVAPLTPPVSPHSAARAAASAQGGAFDSAAAMEALHLGVHSNLHLLLRRLCAVCTNPVVKERPTFEVIHSVLTHFQAANSSHCEWLRDC